MPKLFTTFSLIFISNLTFCQDWKVFQSHDKYIISYASSFDNDTINGISNVYIVLKIENKSNHPIAIYYDKELTYDGITKVYKENQTPLIIEAGNSLIGTCENNSDKRLRIFVSQEQGFISKELNQWNLVNIQQKDL